MSKSTRRTLIGIENCALDLGDEMPNLVDQVGTSPKSKLDQKRCSTLSLPANISNMQRSTSQLSLSSSSTASAEKFVPLLKYQNNLMTYVKSCKSEKSSNLNNNNRDSAIDINIIDITKSKQNRCIEISRNVLEQSDFDKSAGLYEEVNRNNSCGKICKRAFCKCSPCRTLKSMFPILEWLPKYSLKSNLLSDIIAGLTISILHIPQGIAYSLLAGLGPVNGLYVSFFPVLVYTLMGTSHHISIGTFSVASIMLSNIANKVGAVNYPTTQIIDMNPSSAAPMNLLNITDKDAFYTTTTLTSVTPLLTDNPPTTLEVLTCVCLLCGLIQITMGMLRLGSLSLILSEHLVSAFSTAIAFHVATSQFPYIFGFDQLPRVKSGPLKLIKSWIIMAEHMKQINYNSVIYSVIIILILVLFKECIEPRLKKRNSIPIPIDLLLVIFSILMSWLFKFQRNFAIQVVQEVPTGLPKPTIPRLDLMSEVFVDSVILSIVCFAVSLSLAKIFAKKHNYEVRPNQELLALGSANIFSSFFLAYPSSAALSRSTLQEKAGGKTQIAGLVSSAIILTVLLLLAPYLYHLPKCTLSCIILVALKSMFLQIGDFIVFWRISKLDGCVWLVTFCSVVILDINLGLIIGIGISVIAILIRLALPKFYFLGQLNNTEIYAEDIAYANLQKNPDLKILRIGSPLFFLNVELFKQNALSCFEKDQSIPLVMAQSIIQRKQTLILDLSGVTFIDKAGIDTLVEVVKTLQKQKISTALVMCPLHIQQCLRRDHFEDKVQHQTYHCRIYPTIHDAVIDCC